MGFQYVTQYIGGCITQQSAYLSHKYGISEHAPVLDTRAGSPQAQADNTQTPSMPL